MGRIFNSNVQINGLPCHKYILRKLETVVDAATFSKSYINTMLVAGATYNEIEAALPLLSLQLKSNSPIAGYDFSESTNEVGGLSLIDSIRLDENVPTYKRCDQFYRKFDTKKNACLMCPLSSKYLNGNMENERILIMYALSSPAAFDYVYSKGVLPEHFKSVFDLLSYFSFGDRPCCYPLFAKTYTALLDEDVRNDFFSREELVSFGDELLLYHDAAISNGYVPKGKLSAELMTQLSEVLADEVISKSDITGVDIDSIIMHTLNPELALSLKSENSDTMMDELTQKLAGTLSDIESDMSMEIKEVSAVDNTQIAESSNMGAESINELYETLPTKKRRRRRKKKAVVLEQMEITIENQSADTILDEVDTVDVKELSLDDIISIVGDDEVDVTADDGSSDTTVLEEGYSPSGSCSDESEQHIGDDGADSSFHSYKDNSNSSSIVIKEICNLSTDAGRMYYDVPDAGMVGIPIVTDDELKCCALCLDGENIRLLAMFESYVLKDKRLSMELIKTDSDALYLLFFSPRLRAYFYSDMASSIVRAIVKPLLMMNSIAKYCYYPFATISALWKMEIYVNGIYSLFSLGAVLFGDHRMDMSMTLQKLGAKEAVGGVTIHPKADISSIALLYMHCYHNLYHRGKHQLTAKGYIAEYEDRNRFDILLGYSYYQNRCVRNTSVLFTLTSANNYKFLNTVTAVQKGRLLQYSFDDIPVSSATIVRDILCKLSSHGRFKQFKLMITQITRDSFTLYVRPEYYQKIVTVINTTLLSYLQEHDLHGLAFKLSPPALK